MPRGKTLLLAGGASINNATFTGQSLFADGTAAAPSISFTSKSNAGLFYTAAGFGGDNFAVSIAGTAVAQFIASTTQLNLLGAAAGLGLATAVNTAADVAMIRGGVGTLYLASSGAGTDNTGILGDATHRLSAVHTARVTMAQTVASALIGEVTLSGSPPLAIIYNSAITATSTTRIFLTKCLQRPATIGAAVAISTSAAGQATVVSLSTGDTSVVNFWIIPTS